jgi:dihydropteroate synthase
MKEMQLAGWIPTTTIEGLARSALSVPAAQDALLGPGKIPISADTFSPEVARAALAAGAAAINDIGGGEDAMLDVAAETGCGLVLMHMQGTPATMQVAPRYDDVITDLSRYFAERLQSLTALGIGLTVLVGTGLMTLVFIGSARGHDDAAAGPPEKKEAE